MDLQALLHVESLDWPCLTRHYLVQDERLNSYTSPFMSIESQIQNEFNKLKETHRSILFYIEIGDFWENQDYKFETNLRLLPFQQQTKIISKKFAKDAQTALANQLLQRFISCLFKGSSNINDVNFGFNSFGKPYLLDNIKQQDTLSFSMSNQQGFTSMVINLNGKEVGVDLASVSDSHCFGPENELITNFKDIFHEDEFNFLKELKGDELAVLFTEYWALKESYAKKIGMGLNADLNTFNFKNVKHIDEPEDDKSVDSLFEIQQVKWMDSAKLHIYGNYEKDLNVYVTRLTKDLVVSVVGDRLDELPLVVKAPLDTVLKFFQ